MHCFRRSQSFNSRDLFSVVHQREVEARKHPPAVHMHGAGAALSVIATFLGSGERHCFANAIKQSGPRIDAKLVVLAVNAQRNGDSALDVWPSTGRIGVALHGSVFRKCWYVSRNQACCHTTSRGQKKIASAGTWRTRFGIVV